MVKKVNQQNNLPSQSIKELISNNKDANIRINIRKAEEKARRYQNKDNEDNIIENRALIDKTYPLI